MGRGRVAGRCRWPAQHHEDGQVEKTARRTSGLRERRVSGRALGAGGGLWGGDTRSFPLFQFQLELGSSRRRPVVSTLLNGCAVQEGG